MFLNRKERAVALLQHILKTFPLDNENPNNVSNFNFPDQPIVPPQHFAGFVNKITKQQF